MNWFDLVVVILIVLTLVKGFFSGLIMQVATLAGIILGAIFAGKVAEYITPELLNITNASPQIIGPLSYALAFVVILIVLSFAGKLLESFADALKMDTLNKIGGSLFCAAKWVVIFSILLNLLVGYDQDKKIIKEDIRENSHTYPLVMEVAQTVIPYLRFDWF
ncbi:MAG: CvpA family protein [Prevotella sp.]|jgi:membrane protein required for colicin V production|nr:CvpA family protein [Prevotella sp.]